MQRRSRYLCCLAWAFAVHLTLGPLATNCDAQPVFNTGHAIPDGPSALLQRLWQYAPELPKPLLDASKGLVGDTRNLERCLWKMMTGQPLKVVLMGGSLSLRGWNNPDQTYIKQVHKWLELVLVPGCSDEMQARLRQNATAPPQQQQEQQQELEQQQQQEPGQAEQQNAGKAAMALQPAEGKVIERGPQFTPELHQTPDEHYISSHHVCGGSKIELVMMAVPAAGPGYAERCVLPRLPADTDLLLLDWACNDFVKADRLSHPERHALERILRTALALQSQPAIVMFQAYSWFQAAGTFVGYGKSGHNLAQDKHALLAEYYGNIQVVSVRASVYQLLAATNDTTDRLIYLGRAERTVSDLLHVTNYGHRWYADILINFFRDHIHALTMRALTAETLRIQLSKTTSVDADASNIGGWPAQLLDALKPPDKLPLLAHEQAAPVKDSQNPADVKQRCWASDHDRQQQQQDQGSNSSTAKCAVIGSLGVEYIVAASASAGLKPPFFRGNEADPGGSCAIGPEFRGAVSQSQGWEWVDDGRPGQPKLGYSTQQAHVPLVIDVNVWRSAGGARQAMGGGGSGDTRERSRGGSRAWLVYLTSWRGMGQASISCRGGCACANSTVDAFNKDTVYKTTTPALHGFTLMQHDASIQCQVQVELVAGPPGGPGADELPARFKVMGVTSSNAPVWHLSEVLRTGLTEATAQAGA